MSFKNLHQQNKPLIICNVWDVSSAKIAEELKFKAIGTSSAAIAGMLGYQDGEQMSFAELLYIVKRIIVNTHLPLSVDIESGYSQNPIETAEYIMSLSKLGVVGINIEDSLCLNDCLVTDKRHLHNAKDFTNKLSTIKQILVKEKIDIFINVRTDSFLLAVENALVETLKRIKLYESVDIDGIFVPCIEKQEDILSLASNTQLPINVMCMPNLPDFTSLEKLGVKRISMGNFMFDKTANDLKNALTKILERQSFSPIF